MRITPVPTNVTLAHPEIFDWDLKGALRTFKQQWALKMRARYEFLLFSFERICIVFFGHEKMFTESTLPILPTDHQSGLLTTNCEWVTQKSLQKILVMFDCFQLN